MRSRWMYGVCAALIVAPFSTGQSVEVLLTTKSGDTVSPVLIGTPLPGEVVAGGGFQLAQPTADGPEDVGFATDEAGEILVLDGTRRIVLEGVESTTLADGTRVLELWRSSGAAGGEPVVVRFPADGITVKPSPPGWTLLDAGGAEVDFGLGKPLIIETPLPVEDGDAGGGDDDPPSIADLFVVLDSGVGADDAKRNVPDARRMLLENPETANKIVTALFESDSGLAFLKDLNLEMKVFDSEDGDSTVGFGFDFAKSLSTTPSDEGTTYQGWDFALSARGNVAFDPDLNPVDFIDSRVSYRYFRSTGGIREDLPDPTPEELQKRLDRIKKLADLGDDFKRSKLYAEHSSDVRSKMTPQVHFDIGASAGLEANQEFTARNYTYSLEALLDVKVWNPDSVWSKANILDVPFAAIRRLTGYDDEWSVRGSMLPTVLVAIDQVEPQGNDPRKALGETSSFARLRAEASFRTPIAWIKDSQVFFNANYRIYHELDAESEVKDADLDTFDFLALSITTDSGFLVTFTTGQLPFDADDGESLQAGFKFSF